MLSSSFHQSHPQFSSNNYPCSAKVRDCLVEARIALDPSPAVQARVQTRSQAVYQSNVHTYEGLLTHMATVISLIVGTFRCDEPNKM